MKMSKPVPAARLIVFDGSGRVLILRRAETVYAPGWWCLPGGKVRYGETVEQAAARELRDETSLDCNSLKFLFYQDSLPLEPGGMHCIDFYFECAASGRVAIGRESMDWAWVDLSDADRYPLTFGNDIALARCRQSRK